MLCLQEKHQFSANRELFEKQHVQMAREMAAVQEDVASTLGKLDEEGKKQLFDEMKAKKAEWQQKLASIQEVVKNHVS